MSKIKIKNFGPIKEGYQEDKGFMDVKKVTVFIGNQGSGKSTVAKVISTMMWLEKALNRGDVTTISLTKSDFLDFFEYQRIHNYLKETTEIEYVGEKVSIIYNKDLAHPEVRWNNGNYIVPKIMYVPSERNFLSVIKDAYSVKGLPDPLFEFAEELRKSQEFVGNKGILLPINDVYYKYDSNSEVGIIYTQEFSINMLAASSGFQSLVPLFLVSNNLSDLVSKAGNDLNSDTVSVNQKIRVNQQIAKIMNLPLGDEEKLLEVNTVKSKFISKSFINIVEEPEQNLYPTSQRKMLNSLLAFNNMNNGNKLLMTTHSPYLINYLTLAVKADMVKSKLHINEFKNKIDKIVPLHSTVDGIDMVIYELDEKDGTIKKLDDYHGLPSDENDLNSELEETNEYFAQLQEIEKGWR